MPLEKSIYGSLPIVMKLKPINQQVVTVVRATSGIGRITALRFAERGAKLLVSGRSEEKLASLSQDVQKLGGDVTTIVADVSDFEQVKAIADQAIAVYGRLDTWVSLILRSGTTLSRSWESGRLGFRPTTILGWWQMQFCTQQPMQPVITMLAMRARYSLHYNGSLLVLSIPYCWPLASIYSAVMSLNRRKIATMFMTLSPKKPESMEISKSGLCPAFLIGSREHLWPETPSQYVKY